MKPRVAIDGRLPKAFGLSRQELKRAAENFVARSSARSGIPFREVTVILQDDASSAEVHLAVNGAEGPTDAITQGYDPMPGEEPGVYGEVYVNCDRALAAVADGKIVGAVWVRIMDDYGHIDDETPSFAIALYKEYRGKGIGTELMRRMLELLKAQGYKRASLAVQKANYAVRMYAAVGFRTVDENAEEYIMVRDLQIPG